MILWKIDKMKKKKTNTNHIEKWHSEKIVPFLDFVYAADVCVILWVNQTKICW